MSRWAICVALLIAACSAGCMRTRSVEITDLSSHSPPGPCAIARDEFKSREHVWYGFWPTQLLRCWYTHNRSHGE